MPESVDSWFSSLRRSPWLEFSAASSYRKVSGQLLFFGLWLAVTAIGLSLRPAVEGHGTHQELGFPPCPSVLLFNRPCPGCGLTTSWTRLLHGDFPGSFEAHALGPVMYAIFTIAAFAALFGFVRKAKLGIHTWKSQAVMVAFLVVFMTYGLARFSSMNHYQTLRESGYAAALRASR